MSNWAIATITTRHYLHFTRALAQSVRQVHPDVPILACLVDAPPPGWVPDNELFRVVFAHDVGIKLWRRFLFQYNAFEVCCALKSLFLLHLLETNNLDKVLLLDGDVLLCSALDPLLDLLDHSSVLLTPQLAHPRDLLEPDPWEMDILDTGVYNIGFMGLRRSSSATDMLKWWSKRVEKRCKCDINFYEQGWLDAVPAFFAGVHIVRDPQFNLTPQNLHGLSFSRDPQGQILVNGLPICFFHFVSIDPHQALKLSKCSRGPLREEPALIQELYADYVQQLQDCGMRECRSWGYQYARLDDGTEIRPEWRELIRTDHPELKDVENPFALPASTFRRLARKEDFKRLASKAGRVLKRILTP